MMADGVGKRRFVQACLRVVLLGIVTGATPVLLHGDEISFSGRQEMTVSGKLKEARSFDFTGDGLRDIVALSENRDEEKVRWMASLFVQTAPGRFENDPDRVVEIDTLAALIAPTILPGRSFFDAASKPSLPSALSSALPRTLQVLTMTMSASASLAASL